MLEHHWRRELSNTQTINGPYRSFAFKYNTIIITHYIDYVLSNCFTISQTASFISVGIIEWSKTSFPFFLCRFFHCWNRSGYRSRQDIYWYSKLYIIWLTYNFGPVPEKYMPAAQYCFFCEKHTPFYRVLLSFIS